MPGPVGSKFFLPWFFGAQVPGPPPPTTYPNYLYYSEVGATGGATTEPAIGAYAPAPFLSDSDSATYYAAAIGASFPAALVSGIVDFGVRVRITAIQADYQASLLASVGGSTYNYDTGVDDGAGGITWTERSAGNNATQPDTVPTLVSVRAVSHPAVDARYVRFTLFTSSGIGQIRLNRLLVTQTSICDPPAKVLGVAGLGACEGAQATISWLAAATATGYKIERTNPDGTVVTSTLGNVTTTVVAPLTIGSTYIFRVRAFNSCGDGEYSGAISVTPCTIVDVGGDPPPTPTNLRWLGVCEGTQNTILWSPSAGAYGYKVKIDGGTPIDVGNVTVYVHTPTVVGTAYSYQVAAYNPDGESAYTTAVSVTGCNPPPPPPVDDGFSINAYGQCMNGKVMLWLSPTTGANTYEIWRRSDVFPDGDGELVYEGILPTQEAPYTDEPVPIGVPLTYKARGKNTGGYTSWTGSITITPCGADGCEETFYVVSACCNEDTHCHCGSGCSCTPDACCSDPSCDAYSVVTSVSTTGTGGSITVVEGGDASAAQGESGSGSSGGGHAH